MTGGPSAMTLNLNRLLDRIEDGLAVIAAGLLLCAVLMVSLEVVARYFFNSPLSWTFEVTEYFLLFIPCLGMGWLARHDGHVSIDIVTGRLPEPLRSRLARVVALCVSAACLFVAVWGAIATWESYSKGARIEAILQTPQFLIYSAIPLGFFVCALEYARKALRAAPGEAEST
jgi:TRAP-type C4-dicarboxylate transport system permease small subunit